MNYKCPFNKKKCVRFLVLVFFLVSYRLCPVDSSQCFAKKITKYARECLLIKYISRTDNLCSYWI